MRIHITLLAVCFLNASSVSMISGFPSSYSLTEWVCVCVCVCVSGWTCSWAWSCEHSGHTIMLETWFLSSLSLPFSRFPCRATFTFPHSMLFSPSICVQAFHFHFKLQAISALLLSSCAFEKCAVFVQRGQRQKGNLTQSNVVIQWDYLNK